MSLLPHFRQNVALDAALARAQADDMFMHAAMMLGFEGPDDAIARAKWLSRQPNEYKDKVMKEAMK